MKYERQVQLPTKCVPDPKYLVRIFEARAGKGNFHIEMRHNMYLIGYPEHVDIKDFLRQRD